MKTIIRIIMISFLAYVLLFSSNQVKADEVNPADGEGYAVLTYSGQLIFFRSYNNYEECWEGIVEDIHGNLYKGTVYTDVENGSHGWNAGTNFDILNTAVKNVYVAEDTVIKPVSCDNFFSFCTNLISFNSKGFDTGNVLDMSEMFYNCTSLTSLDLSYFDTGNVEDMQYMFYKCNSLASLDLDNFNTGKVTNMRNMFYDCDHLTSLDLSSFNTGSVTDMYAMFGICTSLKSLDLSSFDTSNVVDMASMFWCCNSLSSIDLDNFDTGNVESMAQMFTSCTSLTSLDLSSFDTGNVKQMFGMFSNCNSLTSLDLSHFDTRNVQYMFSMFSLCKSLTSLDIRNFDTGNATNMEGMFEYCRSLSNLDVSSFDTHNVTTMNNMFHACEFLTSLDLSNFDTGNVTDMRNMFGNCTSLTSLDVSSFDTGKVTDMRDMFCNCWCLQSLDMSNFDTSNVSEMKNMFDYDKSLRTVKLGTKFTKWIDKAYLPDMYWTNDVIVLSRSELYNQYPSHAEEWAGIWRRHDYEYKGITWREDNSAYATFECSICHEKVEKECAVTVYITATCTEPGLKEYTAEVEFEGYKYKINKDEYQEALGHDYELTGWNWADDYSSAEAIFECVHDSRHIETVKAEFRTVNTRLGSIHKARVTFIENVYEDIKSINKYAAARIYGDNRYETSLKAAEELKNILGVDKFEAVVLTTGGDFADALSGSYLANSNNAPVILVRDNAKKTRYLDNVINFIKSNVKEGGTVYVLGGESAVPDEWLVSLTDYDVKRLYGNSRYATNIEILKEVGYTGGEILVCTGKDFADSLSASAVDLPILLVNDTGKLNNAQKNFLSTVTDARFIIIGGEGAVSKETEEALGQYGTVIDRLAGSGRYETSTLIAERFFNSPETAVLAYGQTFPDGLGGGALAHALKSPFILAGSTKGRSKYASEYCGFHSITSGYVLGGNTLITDEYVRKIFNLEDGVVILE